VRDAKAKLVGELGHQALDQRGFSHARGAHNCARGGEKPQGAPAQRKDAPTTGRQRGEPGEQAADEVANAATPATEAAPKTLVVTFRALVAASIQRVRSVEKWVCWCDPAPPAEGAL
jgi:hypothetical protein